MVGGLLGVVAGALGLPGVVVVWLGVRSWLGQQHAPELTGKGKGVPAPADETEAAVLRRHRVIVSARRSMLWPSRCWLPGWPLVGSWLTALLVAGMAALLPAAFGWVRMANAASAFLLMIGWARAAGVDASRGPGVRLASLPAVFGGRRRWLPIAGSLVGAATGAVMWWAARLTLDTLPGILAGALPVVLARHLPAGLVSPITATTWWWLPGLMLLGAEAGMWRRWRRVALAGWVATQQAAAMWDSRFADLKINPAPRLVSHDLVGPAAVDVFDAPPQTGVGKLLGLSAQLPPFLGSARAAVLECADVDDRGQEIPGSVSASRFRILTWADSPNITDPALARNVARLWAESCAAWASEQAGLPHPVLLSLEPITTSPPPSPERQRRSPIGTLSRGLRTLSAFGRRLPERLTARMPIRRHRATDHQRGELDHDQLETPDVDPADAEDGSTQLEPAGSEGHDAANRPLDAVRPSPVMAWSSQWNWQGGSSVAARSSLRDPLAGELGCPVLIDHRGDIVYFGALHDQDAVFDDSDLPDGRPETSEMLRRLDVEDWWLQIWYHVQKQGTNPPTIEHNVYTECNLDDRSGGRMIFSQPFVVRQGEDPADFFGHAAKIATAIGRTTLCHVLGFPNREAARPGSRHPQAFVAAWSHDPIPTIQQLPAASDMEGPRIVLSSRIAAAFADHKLAQPEVIKVARVTRNADRGIWRVWLRLYGTVTLETLRKAEPALRTSLDVDWLRIVDDDGDVLLVCGASPSTVRLPASTAAALATLDWENAFAMAKCTGNGGSLPTVSAMAVLPGNDRVDMLDVVIPDGLTTARLIAAQDALKKPMDRGWIQIGPHPEDPRMVRMLAASADPMPTMAPYRFDMEFGPRTLGIAADMAGAAVLIDIDEVAHIMMAGASGTGKSGSTRALLCGALRMGAQVVVIDEGGQGVDYAFADPWLAALALDALDAEAVLTALVSESDRRLRAMRAHNVQHARHLVGDESVPPVFVFVDELLVLIGRDAKPPDSKVLPDPEMEAQRLQQVARFNARKHAAALLGQLFAQARKTDIHVVAINQVFKQEMLPGELSDLKTNSNRLLLGHTGYPERAAALRDPNGAPEIPDPAPLGRALWEPMFGAAQAVQMWYAEPDDYAAELARRLDPLAEEDKIDLSSFRRAVATSQFTVLTATVEPDSCPADEVLDWSDWVPAGSVDPEPTTGTAPVSDAEVVEAVVGAPTASNQRPTNRRRHRPGEGAVLRLP